MVFSPPKRICWNCGFTVAPPELANTEECPKCKALEEAIKKLKEKEK